MKPFTLPLSFLVLLMAGQLNGQNTPYRDKPFLQEYHDGYLIDTLNRAANEVRGIHPDADGNIWIATKNGIYRKKAADRTWELMVSGEDQGPAYAIGMDAEGGIWIGAWDGVYQQQANTLVRAKDPRGPIAEIVTAREGVYALGPYGSWLFRQKVWTELDLSIPRSIRAARSDGDGGLWIGTDVGLYHCAHGKTTALKDTNELISAYVRGLDYSDNGSLWVGGLGGLTIRNHQQKIAEKRPKDGLPNAHVNVVRKAPDGTMWVGTDYGIARFPVNDGPYSVRLSKRWLMSDKVLDIAFGQDGNAWIATAGGVSAIKQRSLNLAQKADYFYDRMIRRNVRDPWIVGRFRLTTAGDTTSIVPDDDDNDGEYNAMYLAMESFRYAVTGDPVARERAGKAFDFLHFLREVTGTDGFFARTIIPADWEQMHDPNRTYTPQELADELIKNPRHKPVEERWHLSADGKWKWKGDTSSDELSGHLFGYYWYYRLVADKREKERISRHVGLITDHLIRNDFYLVDIDGKPTKWGVWSPQSLNQDPDWAPEKALNALEILSWLKFAAAITGNPAYQEAYLRLIEEENYLENAKAFLTPNPAFETYFDIFLALYVFPPLIEYEADPELKRSYKLLLDGWFAKNRQINSPLVNFTYNLLAGGKAELDQSVAFLTDTPLDLVDWSVDNGPREDLSVVRHPILEELQMSELRPPSEYRSIRWDKNPYLTVAGNPHQEREPVFWLLPYWMGRHLGLITEPVTTKVAAHRGANQFAPENTLAAARKAIDLGADYIEIDIRLTADRQMVILHDASLDRTTDGTGPVSAITLAALKKLSAGGWFDASFVEETVPSLEEFCAAVNDYRSKVGRSVAMYVDCKAVDVPEMVETLRKHHLLHSAVFYGSTATLLEIRRAYPPAKLMPGLSDVRELDRLADQLGPYAFDVKWDLLSEELIEQAHQRRVLIFSDGIGPKRSGVAPYRKAIQMGIDLIQTDRILDFYEALEGAN